MTRAETTRPSARPAHPALEVSLGPLADRRELEREWHALEARSRPSFFQSWDWMGSFVESLPADREPRILRVLRHGELVGLGLLWPRTAWRHGFARVRSLHLNETGDPQIDAVTIEHNGLLAASGLEDKVIDAALGHLWTLGGWDEIALAGLRGEDQPAWRDAAARLGLRHRIQWDKPHYYVDLDRVRAAGSSYLDALSANTRYQIRRAMRGYADRGALRCEHAASQEQAIQWLRELARLHQAQWTPRGQAGAFGSDFAVGFHERLVARGWPGGRVLVTRLTAGDTVLGYLYNFCRDGVVYNYQSGHIEAQDPKLKPGLVCHCLAVEDALQRRYSRYDLLMGGGHFKASLTNASGPLRWATLQRPRVVFQIEDLLRRCRDRWRATPPVDGSAGAEAAGASSQSSRAGEAASADR